MGMILQSMVMMRSKLNNHILMKRKKENNHGFFSILTLIGGLALFLYGMNAMGDGLAESFRRKAEKILENLTSNR